MDTASGSATLAIQHAGGGQLLTALPQMVTPAFDGTAAFNVNGTYITIAATATWNESFGIGGVLELTGHPVTNTPGLAASIELSMETNTSAAQYSVSFDGGIKVGSGIPTLGARGSYTTGETMYLELNTHEEWEPMPLLEWMMKSSKSVLKLTSCPSSPMLQMPLESV